MRSTELIKTLRRIEIRTLRLANEQFAGNYQSAFKGRGMAFSEVRPYQPGDDVRFIDWNVTARMRDAFVKVFTEEREITVMLVVDVSASSRFGSGERSKAERIAELSALLAFSAIKNNDRVGLILFSDRIDKFVPAKKGRAHVMRVVGEVVQAENRGRETRLDAALTRLARIRARHSVVFVISDFIATGYEQALRMAAARHDVIPLVVSDPREESLPKLGLTCVEDLESGMVTEIDLGCARLHAAYQSLRAARRTHRQELFRRLRLDACELNADEPYLQRLSALFNARRRRIGGYR